MKLYTFDNGDGVKRVGVELSGFPGLIRDVRDFGLPYRDMTDLIRHITPSEKERISDPEAALDGHPLRLSAVRVCSPIPHPEQDIICLGVNYAAHADESAQFDRKAFLLDRKKATYFSKRAYQTSGPDDLIPSYPELVTSLDYEAELAVIIGRDCKNVRERDVAACIPHKRFQHRNQLLAHAGIQRDDRFHGRRSAPNAHLLFYHQSIQPQCGRIDRNNKTLV